MGKADGESEAESDFERIVAGREGQRKTHRALLHRLQRPLTTSLIPASCVRTLYLITPTTLEIWAQDNVCRVRNFFSL